MSTGSDDASLSRRARREAEQREQAWSEGEQDRAPERGHAVDLSSTRDHDSGSGSSVHAGSDEPRRFALPAGLWERNGSSRTTAGATGPASATSTQSATSYARTDETAPTHGDPFAFLDQESQSANPPAQPTATRPLKRKRRRTGWWIVAGIAALLVIVIGAVAWVASRALTAKDALEQAQDTVADIQDQARALDVAALQQSATAFADQTKSAAGATADPLYRIAESFPLVGPNLTALREVSDALNLISTDAVVPLSSLASSLSLDSLAPVDGRINLAPIAEGREVLNSADSAIVTATTAVSAIDTADTIAQISDAKSTLEGSLPKAHEVIAELRSLVDTAWAVLGGDGPRNYLFVFPNNAEATALGGGTASLSLLRVDNGAIAITDQANSTDFPFTNSPVVKLDGNVENIFPFITNTFNWATSRPDFPTAATILQAFWERSGGEPVDGVLSVDPVALSYILEATGPMSLPSGDELSSANALSLLLNEIYVRYSGDDIAEDTDEFFAQTATTVFDNLMNFRGDSGHLAQAVGRGVDNGSIMAFSNHANEQALIEKSRLAGVLPQSNSDSTVTGVYFRDVSVSKTDYYLETAVKQSTNVCTNPASPTFETSVTLHSTMTEELARSLPFYVKGGNFKGEKFSTEVYVYGPVGTRLDSAMIDQASIEASVRDSATDLGRPVARFIVDLAPGETAVVSAKFTGESGTYGPAEVRTTPMVNPTSVELSCG